MPKRSSKKPIGDQNQLAAAIVKMATDPPELSEDGSGKNPAAVMLGRLGGRKGGPARAAKLSPKKRSQIAKKAAVARWSRKGKKVVVPSVAEE